MKGQRFNTAASLIALWESACLVLTFGINEFMNVLNKTELSLKIIIIYFGVGLFFLISEFIKVSKCLK